MVLQLGNLIEVLTTFEWRNEVSVTPKRESRLASVALGSQSSLDQRREVKDKVGRVDIMVS